MQLNFFLIGATLLFIVSQIGYASAADCEAGWTKIRSKCLKFYKVSPPILWSQVDGRCAQDGAIKLNVETDAELEWFTKTLGPVPKFNGLFANFACSKSL